MTPLLMVLFLFYLLRERGHFWQSQPSRLLLGSSALGLGVTAIPAVGGILMPAISATFLLGVAASAVVYFAFLAKSLAFRSVESALRTAI